VVKGLMAQVGQLHAAVATQMQARGQQPSRRQLQAQVLQLVLGSAALLRNAAAIAAERPGLTRPAAEDPDAAGVALLHEAERRLCHERAPQVAGGGDGGEEGGSAEPPLRRQAAGGGWDGVVAALRGLRGL
jgi:hypothetical protein